MALADRIDQQIDTHAEALRGLARKIHDHPELRYEEHQAVAFIGQVLAERGVKVEARAGGLATAFRAVVGRGGGPRVAILAEYDALPEIGHACGHNLIAAGAVGAFLGLAGVADELQGQIELIGTPAEEGGGGKIKLIEAGLFEGLDAAMMYHPFDRDILMHPALASVWLELSYHGSPSHAAAAPWDGQSALTACLDTFRLIDGQRVHFRDGVRVHGYIKNGGQAVNIIPERAAAEFSVRAPNTTELARVRAIVERCARGAALASGVEVQISARQGYRDMRNNPALADRFGAHLASLGRGARRLAPEVGAGSTDMGDVSHVVPSIHPYLAICDAGTTTIHQHAFAACARDDRGLDAMLLAARTMARTAVDVLHDEPLRRQARAFFDQKEASGLEVG